MWGIANINGETTSICVQLNVRQEISLKKIYDEVTEDIFDMSNMRIFKEIEKKEMGMLNFVMPSVS